MQGSWAKAIQDRLKNMRRKPRAEKAGLEFVPSAKKQKLNNHGGESSTVGEMLDSASFERHLAALCKELKKTNHSKPAIQLLMSELAPNRVVTEQPAVHEVLEMYPPLKDFDIYIQ